MASFETFSHSTTDYNKASYLQFNTKLVTEVDGVLNGVFRWYVKLENSSGDWIKFETTLGNIEAASYGIFDSITLDVIRSDGESLGGVENPVGIPILIEPNTTYQHHIRCQYGMWWWYMNGRLLLIGDGRETEDTRNYTSTDFYNLGNMKPEFGTQVITNGIDDAGWTGDANTHLLITDITSFNRDSDTRIMKQGIIPYTPSLEFTRMDWYKNSSMYEILKNYVEGTQGYEFRWNPKGGEGNDTLDFDVQCGEDVSDKVIFRDGYNLTGLEVNVSSDDIKTSLNFQGASNNDSQLQIMLEDWDSISEYGIIEGDYSENGVSLPDLGIYAGRKHLDNVKTPQTSITATIIDTEETVGKWREGDWVKITSDQVANGIDRVVRVVSVEETECSDEKQVTFDFYAKRLTKELLQKERKRVEDIQNNYAGRTGAEISQDRLKGTDKSNSVNMIYEGSLESLTYWEDSGGSTISQETSNVFHGSNSVNITTLSGYLQQKEGAYFNLDRGKSYTLSLYGKLANTAQLKCDVVLDPSLIASTTLATKTFAASGGNNANVFERFGRNGEFIFVVKEDTFNTVGQNRVKAFLRLINNGTGNAYIDAIQLEEGLKPSAYKDKLGIEEYNLGQVSASDLNLAMFMVVGNSGDGKPNFYSNTPASGFVKWENNNVVYEGNVYPVKDFATGILNEESTTFKYIYWAKTSSGGLDKTVSDGGDYCWFGSTNSWTNIQNAIDGGNGNQDFFLVGINDNGIFKQRWNGTTIHGGAVETRSMSLDTLYGGMAYLGGSIGGSYGNGLLEIYNQDNDLISRYDKQGIKLIGDKTSNYAPIAWYTSASDAQDNELTKAYATMGITNYPQDSNHDNINILNLDVSPAGSSGTYFQQFRVSTPYVMMQGGLSLGAMPITAVSGYRGYVIPYDANYNGELLLYSDLGDLRVKHTINMSTFFGYNNVEMGRLVYAYNDDVGGYKDRIFFMEGIDNHVGLKTTASRHIYLTTTGSGVVYVESNILPSYFNGKNHNIHHAGWLEVGTGKTSSQECLKVRANAYFDHDVTVAETATITELLLKGDDTTSAGLGVSAGSSLYVDCNMNPNGTKNLGNSVYRWSNIYADEIHLRGNSSSYGINLHSGSRLYVNADICPATTGLSLGAYGYTYWDNVNANRFFMHRSDTGTGSYAVFNGNELMKTSSSKRYKKNISGIEVDTMKILDLIPVSFDWKRELNSISRGGKRDFGLIAEDVAEVIPELATYDEEGKPASVRYEMLSVLLLSFLVKWYHSK